MKRERERKRIIGIIAGIIIGVLTIFAVGIVFLLLVFFGGPPETITDVDRYEEALSKYDNMRTGFIVFPEEISDNVQTVEFYFWYQDVWNTPTCQVYLQCTYNEEEYEEELKRLDSTKKVYDSTVKKLLYEEPGRFEYPVYLAIDGIWHAYEYALLTGENQITYVYLTFVHENKVRMDNSYLPSDYEEMFEESDAYEIRDKFNIYLRETTSNDKGQIEGWNFDYSRKVYVE